MNEGGNDSELIGGGDCSGIDIDVNLLELILMINVVD